MLSTAEEGKRPDPAVPSRPRLGSDAPGPGPGQRRQPEGGETRVKHGQQDVDEGPPIAHRQVVSAVPHGIAAVPAPQDGPSEEFQVQRIEGIPGQQEIAAVPEAGGQKRAAKSRQNRGQCPSNRPGSDPDRPIENQEQGDHEDDRPPAWFPWRCRRPVRRAVTAPLPDSCLR